MGLNAQVQFVHQDKPDDNQLIAQVAAFDADGNPVDVTGGGTTSGVADGAVMPKALSGYDAGTSHGKLVKVKADGSGFDFVDDNATPAAGSVTTAMLADGAVTSEKVAAGVIPAAPTADTLSGATDTGKAVLKAKDAATARTAIGAGTSNFTGSYNDLTNKPAIPAAYTLPAATVNTRGGVKQAAYVPDPAGDAPTKAEYTALRDALVTAGLMAPKA